LQPSRLIGRVAFWFIFALAILAAVSTLGIAALSDAVCAKSAEAPAEAKPHISNRGNPFPLIKVPTLGGLDIAVNG